MNKVNEIMELVSKYGYAFSEAEEDGHYYAATMLRQTIEKKLLEYLPKETISKEQALKMYGDVILSFACYNKHIFEFRGELDGVRIMGRVGQQRGDVYGYEMNAGKTETLKVGSLDFACIYAEDDFVYWEGEI
jgi:hypothetical protein